MAAVGRLSRPLAFRVSRFGRPAAAMTVGADHIEIPCIRVSESRSICRRRVPRLDRHRGIRFCYLFSFPFRFSPEISSPFVSVMGVTSVDRSIVSEEAGRADVFRWRP